MQLSPKEVYEEIVRGIVNNKETINVLKRDDFDFEELYDLRPCIRYEAVNKFLISYDNFDGYIVSIEGWKYNDDLIIHIEKMK